MYPMNIWNGLYMPVVLNQEAGAHWGGGGGGVSSNKGDAGWLKII